MPACRRPKPRIVPAPSCLTITATNCPALSRPPTGSAAPEIVAPGSIAGRSGLVATPIRQIFSNSQPKAYAGPPNSQPSSRTGPRGPANPALFCQGVAAMMRTLRRSRNAAARLDFTAPRSARTPRGVQRDVSRSLQQCHAVRHSECPRRRHHLDHDRRRQREPQARRRHALPRRRHHGRPRGVRQRRRHVHAGDEPRDWRQPSPAA